jgi:hypothetical protein
MNTSVLEDRPRPGRRLEGQAYTFKSHVRQMHARIIDLRPVLPEILDCWGLLFRI